MGDKKDESSDDCPTQSYRNTPSTASTHDKVHDKHNGTGATDESERNIDGTNASKSDTDRVIDSDKPGLDSDDVESDAKTTPSEQFDADSDVAIEQSDKSKIAVENIVNDTSRFHGDTASNEIMNDASRASADSSRATSQCDTNSNCCKPLHDTTNCADANAGDRAVLMTCLSGDAVTMVAKLTDAQVVTKCVDTLKKLFPDEVGYLFVLWYAQYKPLLQSHVAYRSTTFYFIHYDVYGALLR